MKTLIRFFVIITFTSLIFSQSVEIKDSADNLIITINDEGDTGGSITFPNATSVDPTTNKLYNIDNNLYWNGTILESGGSPVWSLTGNKIYYNLDNVGIGVADPDNKLTILQNHADQQGLVVTQSGTGGGSAATFEVTDLSSSGHALNVYNSGTGYGMDLVIHGSGTGPGGRFTIDNLDNDQPAIYAEHQGVGHAGFFRIGKDASIQSVVRIETAGTGLALDAQGTVQMNGFKMPVGVVDGHVLTTDGSGIGTWQAPQGGGGGADSDWNIVGNDMHSNVSGNVGIGEPNPTIKLHVVQMEDEGAGMFILGNTGSNKVALTAETNGNGNGRAFMAVAKGADGNAGYFLIEDSNNPQVGLYSQTNGTGAAIRARTDGIAGTGPGTGSAGWFSTMNALNTAPALRAYTIGEGSAGTFRINNGLNNSASLFSESNGNGPAIEGKNNGNGSAGWFQQENPANGQQALYAGTNGGGPAFEAYTNGGGIAGKFFVDNPGNPNAPALLAETNSDGGPAGEFQVLSAANDAPAIIAHTNGSGPAVFTQTHGTGHALQVGIANPSSNATSLMVETDADAPAGEFKSYHPTTNTPALRVETGSTGAIGEFHQTNPGNGSVGLFVTSNGGGASIEGKNDGSGRAAWFHQDNPANPNPALVVETNSTNGPAGEFYINDVSNGMPTIRSETRGTGNAGSFIIDNTANNLPAIYANTNGTGPAIYANGAVRMSEFHMPVGQVDGHILTTDGAGMGTWQTPPSADNLGNHTATSNINLSGNWLSGDGDDEGIYINAGGAIGAGTSTLLSGFDVVNNYVPTMRLSHPSGGIGRLMITTDADVGSSNYVDLIFASDYDSSPNYAGIGQHTDGSLRLTGGSDISSPDMVITDAGNVGIGTTTPYEALHVAGKVRSDTGFNFNNTDGISGTFNFYNDGTTPGQVQSITVSGGIITNVIVTP